MFDTEVSPQTDEIVAPHNIQSQTLADCPLDILMVEDATTDALLTRRALDATHVPYKLRTLRKGNEVIPFLMQRRNKVPDLMILDLGLPCMDGFEILSLLEAGPSLIRAVPIVILSGYEHFDYLWKDYHLYVAACITKPCNIKQMHAILSRIHRGKMKENHH